MRILKVERYFIIILCLVAVTSPRTIKGEVITYDHRFSSGGNYRDALDSIGPSELDPRVLNINFKNGTGFPTRFATPEDADRVRSHLMKISAMPDVVLTMSNRKSLVGGMFRMVGVSCRTLLSSAATLKLNPTAFWFKPDEVMVHDSRNGAVETLEQTASRMR